MRPGSISLNQRGSNNRTVETPRFSVFQVTTVMSAGKVMAAIFWDAEGVLLVDYLDKGHTITGAYYSDLLRQLRETIKQIRRGKCSSTRKMHRLTHPQWQWLLPRNVDSNLSNTHPILVIWVPLTATSSQK